MTGSVAGAASALALAVHGRRQDGSAAAPLNGVSHWLWGERALWADAASARYTASGYGIHHLASTFWATLYERFIASESGQPLARVVAGAAAASAVACCVDYTLAPRRLRPGFEERLSRGALLSVYGAFAAGLAAATWWRQRRR